MKTENSAFANSIAPRRRLGQTTVEFIMVVSFLFFILLTALVISYIYYDWVIISGHVGDAETSGKILAAAVSHVFNAGEGASVVVFVPNHDNATVSFEDHSIVVESNYTRFAFPLTTNRTLIANSSNFTLNANVRVYMLNNTVRLENAQ